MDDDPTPQNDTADPTAGDVANSLGLRERWRRELVKLFRPMDGLRVEVIERRDEGALVMAWHIDNKRPDRMVVSCPISEPNDTELEAVRATLARLGLASER